jgi:2-amino-4-hydroxy-6-hydroxymethyldihydropteridine diphosphokinase
MNSAYISLGSNLGNREENLQKSIALLEAAGELVAVSSLYETEPWKMDDANSFINQVILLNTSLSAEKLMDVLLETENKMGRVRANQSLRQAQTDLPQTPKGALNNMGKYESRIIDLDILFYNDAVISTEKLTIPHPALHQRKFVLEPLAEINPDLIHPTLNKTVSALLLECEDTYEVSRIISK